MDRQAFREKLHDILRNELLSDLQSYIDRRLENYKKLLRLIAALNRKYDDPEIIREGLSSIFGKIGKDLDRDDEKLAEFYPSEVNKVIADFPEQVVWHQREERFKLNNDDSMVASISKGGKNLVRYSSQKWHTTKQTVSSTFGGETEEWEPWTQTIPLRLVIKYHLLDDEFAEWLVHGTERIQLKIITEIENLLYKHSKEENSIDLTGFTDSLSEKVDMVDNVLERQLVNEVNELESKLLWQIEEIGTIEKRASFYNEQRIEKYETDLRQKLQKTEDQWVSTEKLQLERTQNLAQFLSLWKDIRDQNQEFLVDFKEHFQKYLEEPLDLFYEILQESIQGIKTSGSYTYKQIRQRKDQLSDYVSEQLIEPVQHLQNQQIFTRKAEHFAESLLILVNQVPQTISFVYDFTDEREPPNAAQKEIEWRMLLARTIREQILNQTKPSAQKYDDFLAGILRTLVEIEDIIEINLESALAAYKDSGRDGDSDPDDVAGEALERLLVKVEDLRASSTDKYTDIEKIVTEGEQEFGRSIVELLHGGDSKKLQIFRAKFKVKETTKDWKSQVDTQVAKTQDRLSIWSRFGGKKSKEYASEIQQFFGYGNQQVIESKRADIATYLSETDQKMKSLPYIYRQLFKFDEIADERFYVSVPDSAPTLKKAFEQWKQGFSATFALVGEKGSGKSTFLDLMAKQEVVDVKPMKMIMQETIYTEEKLVEFLKKGLDIECKKNIDEVIDEIHQRDQKKVVILDCVEDCFVRNINGYEAIEKLCYLISETKDQIFWMVSCSRYAWQFLDKTQSINEYFSHTVKTDTLNADQIEKVIINRHRSSGYNLQFEPGEEIKNTRAYRKLQDQPEKLQEYIKRKYFEKLTELAEGNASIAMILWIRSIRDFDDTSFYIRPLEVTSIEMIEELSPQVLFTLAAFVLHDRISDNDLSMILNLTKEESRLMLIRLRSRGLLLRNGEYYSLNHLVYRQIVRGLKERNIIHLV